LNKKYSFFFVFFIFISCTRSKENKLLDYLKNLEKLEESGLSSLDLIKTYKRIITLSPNTKHSDEAIVKIAELYYNSGVYKEAIKYYKLYLELVKLNNQKTWEINNLIADIYFSKYANYEKALEHYVLATNYAYDNKQIFLSSFYIGKTNFFLFNFETAYKNLQKAYQEFKENYEDKNFYQELLYYFAYAEFLFLRETKDSYTASGFGYLEQNDIDNIISKLDQCILIDAYSKYGVLCKYLKSDMYIENDTNDKALDLLKELRGSFPNPDALEYRINSLEK